MRLSLLLALILAAAAPGQDWILRSFSNAPPPSVGAALAFDESRGHAVLFGGAAADTFPPVVSPDTWQFDGSTWSRWVAGTAPPSRAYHGMVHDAYNKVVLMFGGIDGNGSPLNDLWEFDGTSWSQIHRSNAPPARGWPAMAYDGSAAVVFGGSDPTTGTHFADTWVWATSRWSRIDTGASTPSARRQAGMARLGDGVVLHGGRDAGGTVVGDTWTLGRLQNFWVQANPGPGRAQHVLLHEPETGSVYLAGGESATGATDDLWRFDGTAWLDVSRTPRPTAVRGAAGAVDPGRDRMVVFGGVSGTAGSAALDEHWEFGPTVLDHRTFGSPCAASGVAPKLRLGGRARLGSSILFVMDDVGRVGLGFLALGFSDTTWNGAPLPRRLGAYGLAGCQLHVAVDRSWFMAPTFLSPGRRFLALVIPPDPVLLDLDVFAQGLVVGPTTGRLRGVTGAVAARVF